MTSLPTLEEVVRLHRRLIAQSGGADELRDVAALESALPQPEQILVTAHCIRISSPRPQP